jgi:dipeptide transport system substrate-binding protein
MMERLFEEENRSRMTWRRIMKTGTAAFAILSLVFSTGSSSAATLVYCSEGSPETFNPQLATSGTTFDASSRQVYNRLVEFRIGTTELEPGLAESWSISDDGLEYTFRLRHGVKFHTTKYFTPTRDFNADDVLFSFNRQRDPQHPYFRVSGGVYKYYQDMDMGSLIRDVARLDDYTVKFVLNRPESPFLANMAMDFASILSKEYADRMVAAGTPEKVDLEPVGTGPFLFDRYQKDAFIRYRAHPDYWRGKEQIDKLVFAITVDPSVRYARLRAGECQVMAYPLPADLLAMKKNPVIEVDEQPGLNIGYWAFNVTKKPFDDVRVRRALNHAVNRQAILDGVFLGTGTMAKNPIPPTLWSYDETTVDYQYDTDKARALLAEAGLSDGFDTDIWAMPVQRPYNPNARKMAEMIQQDLKNIGVRASVVSYEWGTYLSKSRAGEHQTILLGWTGDNGDPDNFFTPLLSCASARSGNNRALWCNEEFDQLITQARAEPDQSRRSELYKKAQVVFKREAPWLTIAHSVRYQPRRSSVKGIKIDPFGGVYFSGVTLDE